jgi:riboflavin synthase
LRWALGVGYWALVSSFIENDHLELQHSFSDQRPAPKPQRPSPMFTGLVEHCLPLTAVLDEPPGKRLVLAVPAYRGEITMGESIALNGCCLTVVEINGDVLHFQAGPETLARTNLGQLAAGSRVNIERSLRFGDRLGGHLVTGHIDGLGSVARREDVAEWSTFYFAAPPNLLRQMASKGSIAVDGVSLTLVEVTDQHFSVQLIPHTLAVTTLGAKKVGDPVNLETDLLAKYVERQLGYLRE